MTFKNLQELIDDYLGRLPDDGITAYDANPLAVQFLKVSHKLARAKLQFGSLKTKYESLYDIEFKEVYMNADYKTATEKKIYSEATPKVIAAKEKLQKAIDRVEYLKTSQKIFENAHILCRQVCNERDA